MFFQKEIRLPKYHRGFHLITDYIINDFDQIKSVPMGLLHIFIKHTSASITINENCSIGEMLKIIQKNDFIISFIPIIDNKNKLTGCITFWDLIISES